MSSKNNQKNVKKLQNPTEMLDNMLAQKLLNTPFVMDDDTRIHITKLMQALHQGNLSLSDLCSNIATFQHLCLIPRDFTEMSLLDASYFLNSTARIKPCMLGMDIQQYNDFMNENDKASVKWNEIVLPIKSSLMREVEAKFARKIIMPDTEIKIVKK